MNFYTSDLHFFHKNICNLTDRNTVTNPENHTQWLIDLWNFQVSEYNAPDDFELVWQGEIKTNFSHQRKEATHKAVEKLFKV